MDDFTSAFNKKKSDDAETGVLEKPFIGNPYNLPQAQVEELRYRFQYLQESVEDLAFFYRLTPQATKDYIKSESLQRKPLEDAQQLADFESEANAIYKQKRIKLGGLIALHTAKSWPQLAAAEDDILASLVQASKIESEKEYPDVKRLSSLANIHNKLVDKHLLLKNAIDVPADKDIKGFIDTLTKSLEDVLDRIDGTDRQLPSEEMAEDET